MEKPSLLISSVCGLIASLTSALILQYFGAEIGILLILCFLAFVLISIGFGIMLHFYKSRPRLLVVTTQLVLLVTVVVVWGIYKVLPQPMFAERIDILAGPVHLGDVTRDWLNPPAPVGLDIKKEFELSKEYDSCMLYLTAQDVDCDLRQGCALAMLNGRIVAILNDYFKDVHPLLEHKTPPRRLPIGLKPWALRKGTNSFGVRVLPSYGNADDIVIQDVYLLVR